MRAQPCDGTQTRMAIAAHFAALANALGESSPSLANGFFDNLKRIQQMEIDAGHEQTHIYVLETLAWTIELMQNLKSSGG